MTFSKLIKHLIPTKELRIVKKAFWLDIIILDNVKKVILRFAAREISTSTQVRISC